VPEDKETPHSVGTTNSPSPWPSDPVSAGQVQLLKEELAQTKQQLQTILHEWEGTKEELRQRTRQLRMVASELIWAEQKIRQEIAQTLHDQLQQLLFATQVQVQFVSQVLVSQAQETAHTDIKQIKEMLGEALQLTRRLTRDISPILLQGQDAAAVMSELAEQMKEWHGLEVELHISTPGETLEADRQQLIFPIVRELLSNVVKHSGVQRATVYMVWEAEHLILQIEDKGRGFALASDWPTSSPDPRSGLRRAYDRLALFGGHMDVVSRPSQGTTITIQLPTRDREQ